ncbi:MAG: hypothetical protein ACI8WA_000007 [Polaribacter sp.]|jgi:hypothetical protein
MLAYLVLIGIFVGFTVSILIMIKWFFRDYAIYQNSMKHKSNDLHDCDDYIICDEGHPEKPFKCKFCGKRY